MTDLTTTESRELATLEASIESALPAIERGQSAVLAVGEALYKIKARQLYRAGWPTLDDYCQERWGFSGSRGSQWADAFAIYRAIAASRPDGLRGADALEFMSGFTESHARALKALPPAQQVQAWETAKAEEERPTAKLLARIAAQFSMTPEEVEATSRDSQQQMFGALQAAFAETRRLDDAAEIARMAAKRNRKVVESLASADVLPVFTTGEYHVSGGVAGLARMLLSECERIRGELETPLLGEPKWVEAEAG